MTSENELPAHVREARIARLTRELENEKAKAKAKAKAEAKAHTKAVAQSKQGWLLGEPTQTLRERKRTAQTEQPSSSTRGFRGSGKPERKELIHVPQHVLQYFDVSNDPYYINSMKTNNPFPRG